MADWGFIFIGLLVAGVIGFFISRTETWKAIIDDEITPH